MRSEQHDLSGDSAGTRRSLTLFRFGSAGRGPKVYLQAGLHADEMPGVLVLQHLMAQMTGIEAAGGITGEILVVPLANPIGLAQWAYHKPLGRMETESMQNFNRHYPDLAELAGAALEGVLTASETENLHLIRQAFRQALDAERPSSDLDELRLALLKWSCDADYVLDLHCDHEAVMHLYASTSRAADTSLLCRATGARLAMLEEDSGGHSFDEANSAPWPRLRRRFDGRFPIPDGCYASTVEYRGQFDVDDATAAEDAANLLAFLGAVGAITGQPAPAHPDGLHHPLGGAPEVIAPAGGVVVWQALPGAMVTKDQLLGHVVEPATGRRHALTAPTDGMMFRRELWRTCLRGHGLAHVSGPVSLGPGHLLGD